MVDPTAVSAGAPHCSAGSGNVTFALSAPRAPSEGRHCLPHCLSRQHQAVRPPIIIFCVINLICVICVSTIPRHSSKTDSTTSKPNIENNSLCHQLNLCHLCFNNPPTLQQALQGLAVRTAHGIMSLAGDDVSPQITYEKEEPCCTKRPSRRRPPSCLTPSRARSRCAANRDAVDSARRLLPGGHARRVPHINTRQC